MNTFLQDKRNLLSQHQPKNQVSDIRIDGLTIITADSSTNALLNKLQPEVIELQSLLKAHFVESLSSLEELISLLLFDYARERSRYIDNLESNLQNNDPEHKKQCKVRREEALKKIEIDITDQVFDEVTNLFESLQRGFIKSQLPRALKMFLYLFPRNWD